jgi:uncharacterized protein (DUF4415 family)
VTALPRLNILKTTRDRTDGRTNRLIAIRSLKANRFVIGESFQPIEMEYDFSHGKRGAIEPVDAGKTRITIRIDDDVLELYFPTYPQRLTVAF